MAWEKICTQFSEGGLGFRTIEEFNLALLAKQLWRLLRNPESLVCRVLRGRYFRYCLPHQTSLSYRPSYGWRSIMAARPLLLSGLRRNISSGFGTQVWNEPWIPDLPARPPKGIGVERDPHLYVNQLIDRDTMQWNETRLRELFIPSEIPLILGIRPSRSVSGDGFSWSLTKSGAYTVRSGYWTARDASRLTCDSPFQGPSVNPLLAHVWNLKTTRKLKHFVWQCITGCLATGERLSSRHIGSDKSCARCGAEEESILHLLFECPPSRQTWALSPIPSSPNLFPFGSMFYNMDFLFWRVKERGFDEKVVFMFPWLLWYIWKARNDKVFNNVDVEPLDVIDLASREAIVWLEAMKKEEVMEEACLQAEDVSRTSATVEDGLHSSVVCSTDGSWTDKDEFSGLGWVVRCDGKELLLGLSSVPKALSPLHVEFHALFWAMKVLVAKSMLSMTFASDSKELVNMVEDPSSWPAFDSELGEFVALKALFVEFSIKFVPRRFNVQADVLAKRARTRNMFFSHVSDVVPDWFH